MLSEQSAREILELYLGMKPFVAPPDRLCELTRELFSLPLDEIVDPWIRLAAYKSEGFLAGLEYERERTKILIKALQEICAFRAAWVEAALNPQRLVEIANETLADYRRSTEGSQTTGCSQKKEGLSPEAQLDVKKFHKGDRTVDS